MPNRNVDLPEPELPISATRQKSGMEIRRLSLMKRALHDGSKQRIRLPAQI